MTQAALNALQTILIRERLILYRDHQRARGKAHSVHTLIEAIVFSEANAENPIAFREEQDTGQRYDSDFPLKNNTIETFLKRRSSSLNPENLSLICNFLLYEGFLSPRLFLMASRHPDSTLVSEFAGIAPTDPRLQPYRYAVEGEYVRFSDAGIDQLWIAAPGRSKPFVTLKSTIDARPDAHATKPGLQAINHDTATPGKVYEGRIYLMPGRSLTLVEVYYWNKQWDGKLFRVFINEKDIILHNKLFCDTVLCRISTDNCSPEHRNRYRVPDAVKAADFVNSKQTEGRLAAFKPKTEQKNLADKINNNTPEQEKLNASLIDAAKRGAPLAIMRALIDGADINFQDPETGRTATHWAASVNALDAVMVLSGNATDEDVLLNGLYQDSRPSDQELGQWRAAKAARDPLLLDQENCFASAFAPVATDDSERNRHATTIWQYLMEIEMKTFGERHNTSPLGFLNVWKPSSVMEEAERLYDTPVPPGFGIPSPENE